MTDNIYSYHELVGRRVLVFERRFHETDTHPSERKILELSPSGKYIKVQRIDDDLIYWTEVDKLPIIEVLK